MAWLKINECEVIGSRVSGPSDVIKFFKPLAKCDQETFWCIGFDAAHQVISSDMIALGGFNFASVDPKVVYKRLCCVGAISCIFIHNHPTGHAKASEEDRHITQQLKKGLDVLGIRFLDHLIIAGDEVVSVTI